MTAASLQALDLTEVWATAVQLLRYEVETEDYLSYVISTQPVASTNLGEFELSVPTPAIADWLAANLATRIEDLVTRPRGLRLVISVDDEQDLFGCFSADTPSPPPLRTSTAAATKGSGLAADLEFANFVSGSCNEVAIAAAYKLATKPAATNAVSPLFIHGSVGLGKTHLAHAIGNAFIRKHPDKRLRVLSGEQFMREVQDNFLNHKIQTFRTRFRKLDLLIIDDIQSIGKASEQTHKQLLGLFNFMTDNKLPLVVTADRSLAKLATNFPERLLSRMGMGINVTVTTPDVATRVKILQTQARHLLNRELPLATAEFLAAHLTGNCRELIGALRRLDHLADFRHSEILSPQLAAAVIDAQTKPAVEVDLRSIVDKTAKYYKFKVAQLHGSSRTQRLVKARHVAMYLCRELTENSLPEIGSHFDAHHTSIMHACRKVEQRLTTDASFAHEVLSLRQQLTQ